MTDDAVARAAIVACGRELERQGLNVGAAGNVGVRVDGGLVVTPTGMALGALDPDDLVHLEPDGTCLPGQRRPTSEWRIHVDVLAARPDVSAVVHTHSPEATAAACLRAPLPAVHYAIARAGAAIVPCASYATYGTAELSAAVLEALGAGHACLMANHGLLAVGDDLSAALALAIEMEWLAGVVRRARAHGLPVHLLPDGEIEHVKQRLTTYGQRPQPSPRVDAHGPFD